MSRHCTDEELIGLVVGDLPGRLVRELGAHTADCAECSAALASTRALWSAAGELRAEDAPEALRDRVGAAVGGQTTKRRPWRLALGATGAAGLAAAGVVAWMALTPSRQTIAFADVQRAMGRVRTLRYITHMRSGIGGPHEIRSTAETWIRKDPPAMTMRYLDATDSLEPAVSLADGRGLRTFMKRANELWVYEPRRGPRTIRDAVDSKLRFLVNGPAYLDPSQPRKLPSGQHATAWRVSNEMLDGRAVVVFRIGTKFDGVSGKTGQTTGGLAGSRREDTIWTDAETHRVVRWEGRMTGIAGGDGHMVEDGFTYDQEPPPGTFVLDPPGARVMVVGPDGEPRPSPSARPLLKPHP